MATLPQASDYGARVALRSSRVDLPGQGEMAVADALANAAATFTNMAIEHKQKDDALSYSNAKSEYLIADIQEREKLKDDQEFGSHDQRYRTAMAGHYDRLFPTVRSKRDQHLFDTEARLMNERGAVAVGENSRTKEIDWNVGQFDKNAIAAQGVIMAAGDAQTAQDAMFTVLEQGAALRARGYLDETTYQAKMQGFVTDTAYKRLVAMDPKEREMLLERSILLAKTKGEPITRDQIAAGEGSGSIADFLPLDERVKMLKTTREGNEHDDTMEAAYGVFDAVTSRYTDPAKVVAALAEAGKGMDPDVRQALTTLGTQYRTNAVAVEAIERDNIMTGAGELIDQGIDPETMNGDNWGKLLPAQRASLTLAYKQKLQGEGFGPIDVMYSKPNEGEARHIIQEDGSIMLGEAGPTPSYSFWKQIPREQRPGINLDDPQWRMAFTQPMWQLLKNEQDQITKEINAAGAATSRSPGLTPMQHVTSALVPMGIIPQTGRNEAQEKIYWTTVANLDRAIADAENIKGTRLTNEEEKQVLANMLEDAAFKDNWWKWPDTDEEDRMIISTMEPEILNRAREPLDPTQKTTVGGIPMTHRQKLENLAKRLEITGIHENDLERANFAMIYLIGTDGARYDLNTITPAQMADVDAEIQRRLRGE